jgi:hypothetical protein
MGLLPVPARCTRIGPRHPRLGTAAFRFILPILERYYARHRTYQLNSSFAAERLRAVRAELDSGATVYLAGISPGGPHNSRRKRTSWNGPRFFGLRSGAQRLRRKRPMCRRHHTTSDVLFGRPSRIRLALRSEAKIRKRQTKETPPPKYKSVLKARKRTPGLHSPFLLTRLVHFHAAIWHNLSPSN